MSKDPAFLFYDGDAARDVSHMNRLERGCYFDLIQAQRKFGSYTTEQARKILGHDFEDCWGAIELILQKDGDKYFIEWVRDSIENRKEYAEKQRKRIQDYWDKKKKEDGNDENPIPRNNHGITTDIPYENEDEIESEDIIDNDAESKNFKKIKKENFSEFVTMLPEEHQKLINAHGVKNTEIFIDILNNYKGSKGKTYKSDYLAILNWVIDRAKNDGKYICKEKLSV